MSTVVPVNPEKILKQLGRLWVDLGQTEEHGVLRACAMTEKHARLQCSVRLLSR